MLSSNGQMLQVAAHAVHHICVRKETVQGRVLTTFQPLSSREEREVELAAMLGMDLPAARQLMAAAGASS